MNQNSILKKLDSMAVSKNFKLSYTNKLVFMYIIKIAIINGDDTGNELEINLSIRKLSKMMNLSNTIVAASLKKLQKLEALERKSGKKTYSTIIKKEWLK